jgi:hypothetical protein
MSNANRVYLVARVGWRVRPSQGGYTNFYQNLIDASARRFMPVAAFADRVLAEARMHELELEVARTFSPFSLWQLDEFTSLSVGEFSRRLAEIVHPLPDVELADVLARNQRDQWLVWWDEHMPSWSDETLAKVWELFDAIHFYAILEVPTE